MSHLAGWKVKGTPPAGQRSGGSSTPRVCCGLLVGRLVSDPPSRQRLKEPDRPSGISRVARGVSAPGSHRTVRKPLDLYGSYRSGHQTAGSVLTQTQWAKNLGQIG